MTVEPIKDKKKIDAFLGYLKTRDERNYLLAKFQLNTGLRICDCTKVKVSSLLNSNFSYKQYLVLCEQKTGKEKKIKINEALRKVLTEYIKNNKLAYNDYLFQSRTKTLKGKNINHITTTQAYRIFKDAATTVGIENFGTHSLRKTWGFWTYKASKHNIGLIMSVFNHSSQKITLSYIGITQEAKDELYNLVQF